MDWQRLGRVRLGKVLQERDELEDGARPSVRGYDGHSVGVGREESDEMNRVGVVGLGRVSDLGGVVGKAIEGVLCPAPGVSPVTGWDRVRCSRGCDVPVECLPRLNRILEPLPRHA